MFVNIHIRYDMTVYLIMLSNTVKNPYPMGMRQNICSIGFLSTTMSTMGGGRWGKCIIKTTTGNNMIMITFLCCSFAREIVLNMTTM